MPPLHKNISISPSLRTLPVEGDNDSISLTEEDNVACSKPTRSFEEWRTEFSKEFAEIHNQITQQERTRAAREIENASKEAVHEAQRIAKEEIEKKIRDVAEKEKILSVLFSEVNVEKDKIVRDGEAIIIEIAFAAICKIIGQQYADHSAVSRIVTNLVANYGSLDELKIFVNPFDYSCLKESGLSEAVKSVLVVSDELTAGEIEIKRGYSSLSAGLVSQLERLREVMITTYRERHSFEQ